jgi:hypothetical protein
MLDAGPARPWVRAILVAMVCLCAYVSPRADTASCPSGQTSGIVWDFEGDWLAGRTPIKKKMTGVKNIATLRPASTTSRSQILILQNGGVFLTRVCESSTRCVNTCRPARPSANEMPPAQFSGLRDQSGEQKFHRTLSRASGWSDAVIAVNADGSLDLADVFRGTRARTIRYRFCPIDASAPCDTDYTSVNWDGDTARVAGNAPASRPAFGLVRIVEDDGISEAWIRLEPSDRAAAVKADYLASVAAIKTWTLPESETPLPSLDRLWRVALASAGTP